MGHFTTFPMLKKLWNVKFVDVVFVNPKTRKIHNRRGSERFIGGCKLLTNFNTELWLFLFDIKRNAWNRFKLITIDQKPKQTHHQVWEYDAKTLFSVWAPFYLDFYFECFFPLVCILSAYLHFVLYFRNLHGTMWFSRVVYGFHFFFFLEISLKNWYQFGYMSLFWSFFTSRDRKKQTQST